MRDAIVPIYMPAVPILEHSGRNEAPDRSDRPDRHEISEETDTSFFRPSYIQACPVHDKHRDLRQIKELTEPRELDSMHETRRSRKRLFCIRLQRYRITDR